MSTATFKVCANCGHHAGLSRRKCDGCGARRAIFRTPTADEIERAADEREKMDELLAEFIGKTRSQEASPLAAAG